MSLFTATRPQIATYLLGVCPFSIAFLVFLNSSVSFIVTDLIGREQGVGDVVGNLGFADELVALLACPFWGLLSDRIGVRMVCVIGYTIIFLALIVFVQAKNVYPQLLLARLFFSLGGAAASTMVTAVLPTMSYRAPPSTKEPTSRPVGQSRHIHAASVASELTITPARFQSTSKQQSTISGSGATTADQSAASTSKVAGFVGMFTGFGALLALFLFLPLPATFQRRGLSPGRALQHSYYIVAGFALVLAVVCFFGLKHLKTESSKEQHISIGSSHAADARPGPRAVVIRNARNLYQAVRVGFRRSDIGIGYLGGFVARASSVGISLFVPLLINAAFLNSGICATPPESGKPGGLPDLKRRCPRAYVVAAELTGIAEVIALVAAPLFGYWSANTEKKSIPLATAAIAGIIGYPLFATHFNPDDTRKADRAVAFLAVCLIGFSQIGAIVCSLASLSTGLLVDTQHIQPVSSEQNSQNSSADGEDSEAQPLLGEQQTETPLSEMKGSVAGVYSFYGGAAILLLTKAGGALFDSVSTGVPFYIMAAFNAILLVVSVVIGMQQYRAKISS